jgi:hypothetical protein
LYKKVPSWWGVTCVPIRGCLNMYIPWKPSIYHVSTYLTPLPPNTRGGSNKMVDLNFCPNSISG